MAPERRRLLLLVVLLIVLVGVFYRAWTDRYAPPEQAASTAPAAQNQRPHAAAAGAEPAQSVHLDELNRTAPKPPTAERDLFRFRPKPAPPPAGGLSGSRGAMPDAMRPPGPPPPPQAPPIGLKFIGIVDQGQGKPKLAVLSDGLGPPMYGFEGGTVAGRYRILRIGAESIDMEYLDGHGRQTIRLSGS